MTRVGQRRRTLVVSLFVAGQGVLTGCGATKPSAYTTAARRTARARCRFFLPLAPARPGHPRAQLDHRFLTHVDEPFPRAIEVGHPHDDRREGDCHRQHHGSATFASTPDVIADRRQGEQRDDIENDPIVTRDATSLTYHEPLLR